jgi:DNA invertase Pin-like site-specific DNA recombinase
VTLIGYARVSKTLQDPALQHDALAAAGCTRTFIDKASGAKADRPQLAAALDYLREGDTLVVWRLDRLGRSLKHLIEVVNALHDRGIGFRSLTEGFDTTTPGGELIFHVFGAVAQFERRLIQERTNAGLAAARARGRLGGRKPKVNAQKIAVAEKLRDEGVLTMEQIANVVGVTRPTLYRHLRAAEPEAAS